MNVLLFVAFRTFGPWRIKVFHAVTINYLVCSLLSGMSLITSDDQLTWSFGAAWQGIGVGLGFLFIGTFYVLGLTTRNFGITIATIASRMSLIVPVVFGLFVFRMVERPFDYWNYFGVLVALVSVVFTTMKDKRSPGMPKGKVWLLPLLLFLLAGGLDTIINYTNFKYLSPSLEMVFIWLIFTTAAVSGLILIGFQGFSIQWRSIAGGLYLGIPNFFSMHYILKALSAFENNGAVLFPIFNVGIIVLSSLAAVIIFKEQLLMINRIGIILAVISVLMISYQELLVWWS